jgi:hypothetical protein
LAQKLITRKEVSPIFERGHRQAAEEVSRLHEALLLLRYEGKAAFSKNLKESGKLIVSLVDGLMREMDFEEKVLFPYLKIHLPKLNLTVDILQIEHGDLRRNLLSLSGTFDQLRRRKFGRDTVEKIEALRKRTSYLSYFLQNHAWAETQSVYRLMQKELKNDEKQFLKSKSLKYQKSIAPSWISS